MNVIHQKPEISQQRVDDLSAELEKAKVRLAKSFILEEWMPDAFEHGSVNIYTEGTVVIVERGFKDKRTFMVEEVPPVLVPRG